MTEAQLNTFKSALFALDNLSADDVTVVMQMIEHAYLIGKTEKDGD